MDGFGRIPLCVVEELDRFAREKMLRKDARTASPFARGERVERGDVVVDAVLERIPEALLAIKEAGASYVLLVPHALAFSFLRKKGVVVFPLAVGVRRFDGACGRELVSVVTDAMLGMSSGGVEAEPELYRRLAFASRKAELRLAREPRDYISADDVAEAARKGLRFGLDGGQYEVVRRLGVFGQHGDVIQVSGTLGATSWDSPADGRPGRLERALREAAEAGFPA